MSDGNLQSEDDAASIMKRMGDESYELQIIVERHILTARIQLDAMEQTLQKAKKANEELKLEMRKHGILPTDR